MYNIMFFSRGDSGCGSIIDTVKTKSEALRFLRILYNNYKKVNKLEMSKFNNGRFECYKYEFAHWIEKVEK